MIIYQVDSFTDVPFKGNPAAVCITDTELSKEQRQHIALEMNLSETTFLVPKGEDSYDISFFTPAVEIDLCGHATLAGAHILFELGLVHTTSTINFQSNAGQLLVTTSDNWIHMNFPASKLEVMETPAGLVSALGVSVKEVFRGNQWKVVVLENEAAVRAANGNPGPLLELNCGHITITAAAEQEGVNYVNRVFAPLYGIPEDPVTGSAQTVLTPYWNNKTDLSEFVCHQLSDRGGVLKTKMLDNNRVQVSGQAVTVMKGELYL